MTKAKLVLAAGILALAGCTDTADSISLEYRNANNEIIDALTMITSEAKAEQMNALVFKTLADRYKKMDNKLKIYENNCETNLELITNVFESEGVHLYLAEIEVNQRRYGLEMSRLRKWHNQLVKEEEENQGAAVDIKAVAPPLYEIVHSTAHPLRQFEKQLAKSELQTKMDTYPTKKGITPEIWTKLKKKYDEVHARVTGR